VAEVFTGRRERLQRNREAFGLKVYRGIVSADEEMTMRNLGARFVPRGTSFAVILQDKADGGRNYEALSLSSERPIPGCLAGRGATETIVDAGLVEELHGLAMEEASIRRDREAMEGKLRSLLGSCSTVKRLKETWPEGARWYESLDRPVVKAALPAVIPQEVNRMIAQEMQAQP
jgi:hypothetical protein